jgi:hypothetical protein
MADSRQVGLLNGEDVTVPLLTPAEFVEMLANTSAPAAEVVQQHRSEYDRLLLHLLVADMRRFADDAFSERRDDLLNPLLGVMSIGLVKGDAAVENAVAVSFVEDTGWWDVQTTEFVAVWPPELRAEADRQRHAGGC